MALQHQHEDLIDHEALVRQQRALYLRLEDGYSRIEQALADGQDVSSWEELWFTLLKEYEAISDDIEAS